MLTTQCKIHLLQLLPLHTGAETSDSVHVGTAHRPLALLYLSCMYAARCVVNGQPRPIMSLRILAEKTSAFFFNLKFTPSLTLNEHVSVPALINYQVFLVCVCRLLVLWPLSSVEEQERAREKDSWPPLHRDFINKNNYKQKGKKTSIDSLALIKSI